MRRSRSKAQLDLFAYGSRTPTPLSRATAKRGRSVEAPAPKPWHCVVLGVDTARISGWAIAIKGYSAGTGQVDTLDEATLDQIVRNAVAYGAEKAIPVVLVLEAPFGGSVDVVAALGVARERWLRAWRNADQPLGRVVKVMPSTWRGPVLGAEWVSAPREEVRRHEQLTAQALSGYALGPDEAPAFLIARWASHAAAVGKAIGKRASKASLRAWTTKGNF